jgi:DNA ligase D-like protein (predicted ligase)
MKPINEFKPMLAKLGSKEDLNRKDLIFEPKLDGTRAVVYKEGNQINIINRRNIILNSRYPELLEALEQIKAASVVLDGEIITIDKTGNPNFYLLAEREHVSSPLRIEILSKQIPATYVVFDILWLNGEDLTSKPLLYRKRILEDVIKENKRINLCTYTEDGEKLFKIVKEKKLEGVMGKVKDSLYFPGERKDCWLKIKYLKTLDCVICAYTKGEGKREKYFGALLCGVYHEGRLRYIGRVGTGWSEESMEMLVNEFKKLECDKNPFDIFEEEPRIKEKIHWIKPQLVAEIKFMNLSKDLKMRAPVFVRLREDKLPEECMLEKVKFRHSSSNLVDG